MMTATEQGRIYLDPKRVTIVTDDSGAVVGYIYDGHVTAINRTGVVGNGKPVYPEWLANFGPGIVEYEYGTIRCKLCFDDSDIDIDMRTGYAWMRDHWREKHA